jgi:hypothetical protein
MSGEIIDLVKFLVKLRKAKKGGEATPGVIL